MTLESHLEREERSVTEAFENGEITEDEYNDRMRELDDEYNELIR